MVRNSVSTVPRRRRVSPGVLLALLFVVPLPVTALPDVPDLWAVYEHALGNDPEFLAAVEQNTGAQEILQQARAVLLPDVSLNGDISANREDVLKTSSLSTDRVRGFYSGELTLELSQPLYRRDLQVALEQAGHQVQQADLQLAVAAQQLMVRVAERYFDVLENLDGVRFADAEVEAIGRQLEEATSRYEVGLSASTDVHETRSALDLARSRLIRARNGLRTSREALREVTGDYRETVRPLRTQIALSVPKPDNIEAWTESALASSKELAAAQVNTRVQRAEIRRREAGHLPTLTIVASSGVGVVSGNGTSSERSWDSSIGLQLNVPIYQGGLVTSQTRQALAAHRQALEQQHQQRRATHRQAREAFNGVTAGIAEVQALRAAVTSAAGALEAVDAGYKVGTRTADDVVSAQRSLYSAERDFSRARYGYILSVLRLKQAAGTLQPGDLAQINGWLRG